VLSNSPASYRPLRRIAIVGTGHIDASLAPKYFARGFDVVASDPGPNPQVNLLRGVDQAWKELTVQWSRS
jgi:hypothetical protein